MRSRRRRASVCWIPGLLLTIAAAAPAQEALVLHVLDCGTMSGIETEAFLPGVEDRPKRFDMVNRCFLVVHPQGTLLWDVGFPDSVSFRFQTFLLWLTTFGRSSVGVERSLVDQLADLGVAPADVDYLALSHSHFDHVGEANAFAASTWLVQKRERAWAFRDDLDREFVQPVTPARPMAISAAGLR